MSFGENLQYLRKMRNKMTQEELAEHLGVSRQTVSKWELDQAYPEIGNILELCGLFSCTMDQLIRENMSIWEDAYSDIREEWVEPFRYLRYAVISLEPEEDAKAHVRLWANQLHIPSPQVIGWDFPVLSQEQINVFHMHGYTAALILPEGCNASDSQAEVCTNPRQKYLAITIRNPFAAPFRLIPNAYRAIMTYMQTNGIQGSCVKGLIDCFEREYTLDGVGYMDIYIAVA